MSPARDLDRHMMDVALRVAALGRPSPNPHVGSVVVRGCEILGVGHHERAGHEHAEVVALDRAGAAAKGATLYVTFEPCNHWGRTGPCTDAIVAAGVRRVVIGCRDPAPHVPGASAKLRGAGIEVHIGVHEERAQRLIAGFAKHITTGLPRVTLKAAMTVDGRMASRTGDSKWITGERARREAHRMRAMSDAVMVGVGTVLLDDPELTVRMVRGVDPVRVVLDTSLRTPVSSRVVAHGSEQPTLIFHGPGASEAQVAKLARAGAELAEVPLHGKSLDLASVIRELGRRDVVELLVEGGGALHGALLDACLVDRVALFFAPWLLGDAQAVPVARGRGCDRIADAWRIVCPRMRRLGDDWLVEGNIGRRPAGGGQA